MFQSKKRSILSILFAVIALSFLASPVIAGDYAALKGVKGLKTVFDVSLGKPRVSNIVYGAIQDVYQDKAVLALPEKPRTVVVFRGPALRLITSDKSKLKPAMVAEFDKFQATIRQMKKDGVTFEVCLYAARMMKIDPATLMKEFDQVGNGFISVSGYQAQGYSVVRIN